MSSLTVVPPPEAVDVVPAEMITTYPTTAVQADIMFRQTAQWTADWYRTYYEKGSELAAEITDNQIIEFMNLAKQRDSFKQD